MPIAAPRYRLTEGVGLDSVKRRLRLGRRGVNASLSLTSTIDFLVVTVVFLLTTFSAPIECGCGRKVDLTGAANTREMVDAPVVVVSGENVFVDGSGAGRVDAAGDTRSLKHVSELFDLLKGKRELWRQTHPSRGFPGAVVLAIDQSACAWVVKSVFQSAASAGYPNVSFMVNTLPKR